MAEEEESYEDLLDFFEKEKDLNSSVDFNLNSDLQPNEEENYVDFSHESSKVLTDIDNILNESSYGTDVSDTEEQQINRVEEEKTPEEATETLEAPNAIAGSSGVKRKAEEVDFEDLLAADSTAKISKIDDDAGGDHQDEGGEDVDDRLLDGEDYEDGDFDNDNMSFEEMAALLSMKRGKITWIRPGISSGS